MNAPEDKAGKLMARAGRTRKAAGSSSVEGDPSHTTPITSRAPNGTRTSWPG